LAIYDIAMSSPFNDALDPNLEPNLALFTDDTSLPERYEELREDRLLLVYSSHITETEQWLQEQQYSAVRLFEDSERQYRNDLKKGYVTILSFAGGLIIIALLQLY